MTGGTAMAKMACGTPKPPHRVEQPCKLALTPKAGPPLWTGCVMSGRGSAW
jgi:hypothetical protein